MKAGKLKSLLMISLSLKGNRVNNNNGYNNINNYIYVYTHVLYEVIHKMYKIKCK